MLSEDQQEIFNDYKNGDNIFITGPGLWKIIFYKIYCS